MWITLHFQISWISTKNTYGIHFSLLESQTQIKIAVDKTKPIERRAKKMQITVRKLGLQNTWNWFAPSQILHLLTKKYFSNSERNCSWAFTRCGVIIKLSEMLRIIDEISFFIQWLTCHIFQKPRQDFIVLSVNRFDSKQHWKLQLRTVLLKMTQWLTDGTKHW